MRYILCLAFLWAIPATALEIVDNDAEITEDISVAKENILVPKETSPADVMATAEIADIDRFIDQGFDVNGRDENGYTPLYYALTQNENLALAEHLIKSGADVNAPTSEGITPLIIATLSSKALKIREKELRSLQISHISAIPEQQIKDYITMQKLHTEKMLNMLIENGADINQETPFGTPLMSAATDEWNLPLVKILLAAGAAVNQQDQNGQTALFYAHKNGCDNIEIILIEAGADTDIFDRFGQTYLDIENDWSAKK